MQLYVSILPFLGRDRALDALWRDLRNAETFEEWEKAGLALDHHYNIDYWCVLSSLCSPSPPFCC